MSSLTETAYYTRKALKYGLILTLVLSVIKFIVFPLVVGTIIPIIFPPEPIPPDPCFGKIPAIRFPAKGTIPTFTPKLETENSELPHFNDLAKVYFMYTPSSHIFMWDETKAWAKRLGFTEEPEEETDYDLIFRNQSVFQKVLKINVASRNFSLLSDYKYDVTLFGQKNAPDKETAILKANQFLNQAGINTPELENGKKEVIYYQLNTNLDPPTLEPVESVSEANFTLVNYFREPISESINQKTDDKVLEKITIPILPPNPKNSLVSILVSGSAEPEKTILEVNYTHYPLDRQTYCTYSLKSIGTAWQELQKKEVFIADFGQNFDGRVIVRKVYLAYFDPSSSPAKDESLYLQPVYVFEGDRDFIAYAPALDSKWIYSK